MELQEARAIVNTLAQGVHPGTGEVLPAASPYNDPQVIRALFEVVRALDDRQATAKRHLPPNAGKPWASDEDARLDAAFTSGADLKPLAQELGRTTFALEARLVKLGRLPPRSGMRVAAAAA
jgi:hypothetical protein